MAQLYNYDPQSESTPRRLTLMQAQYDQKDSNINLKGLQIMTMCHLLSEKWHRNTQKLLLGKQS